MNPPETELLAPPSFDPCWDKMAQDIRVQGFTVQHNVLNVNLCSALLNEMLTNTSEYKAAGIGREAAFQSATLIRNDKICWIEGRTAAQLAWLQWSDSLKTYLNQKLILGLFSFESHFAHYRQGAFYKTHLDAFQGQANRVLSLVAYLNPDWKSCDGGELIIYSPHNPEKVLCVVEPRLATVVAFLSEEFPHEVLPTHVDRYSIAGWYRLNTSIQGHIDPPQ